MTKENTEPQDGNVASELSSSDLLADALKEMLEAYKSLNTFSHDNRNETARGKDRVRLRNARVALDIYAANDKITHGMKGAKNERE